MSIAIVVDHTDNFLHALHELVLLSDRKSQLARQESGIVGVRDLEIIGLRIVWQPGSNIDEEVRRLVTIVVLLEELPTSWCFFPKHDDRDWRQFRRCHGADYRPTTTDTGWCRTHFEQAPCTNE